MGKIDVHHHLLPEEYVKAWRKSGTIPPGLTPPPWTPDSDLAFMDRNGIDTAILSLSAPGVTILPADQALPVARETNQACARLRDAHPARFGFFATLPLVDADADADDMRATLAELAFALDVLRADGVTLFTSYGGRYLGDARFRPLWAELDRRGAVVFVHPIAPRDPGPAAHHVPRPIIDFPHETTRAAVHLITSNTVRDFPRVSIVLSHGGGTLPYVAGRVADLTADIGLVPGKSAEEFMREAKSFYFDLALTGYKEPAGLLLAFAEEGHVLWGSDFPFAREKTIGAQIETLRCMEVSVESRDSVESGAAMRLFPRLSAAKREQ